MDCYDVVHKTLGPNPFGKIVIKADMKDDDNEFSYENQGALETDVFVFFIYVGLLLMFCKDRVKFNDNFGSTIHAPHWYCIIGMGL